MTTINDLPGVTTIENSDLIPLYQKRNRRMRNIAIEEQRTRLNTVSTGATLITPTRATYVDDGTLFIDGTTPFRKLVEDTSNNSHFGQPALVALAANTTYTAQFVVKAAGRTKFRFEATSAASWVGTNPRVTYDIVAVTATGTGGAVPVEVVEKRKAARELLREKV